MKTTENKTPDDKEIKEHVIDLYDRAWNTYHNRYSSKAGKYVLKSKMEKAIKLGNFEKGDLILEVGCANGPFVFEFANNGYSAVGCDISPESIKYAVEKAKEMSLKNVEFIVADAENLSVFKDNSFDGAFSFNTLRYVPDPQKAINEMYRVIKKNKSIVVDFPNKYSPYFHIIRPLLRGGLKKFVTTCSYNYENLTTTKKVKLFLKNAGFTKVKAKRISYPQTQTPDKLLNFFKVIDFISELPIINLLTPIISCTGKKE
jgi:ubiquinone/menaquinone biosynthesis C-methylase UbiE